HGTEIDYHPFAVLEHTWYHVFARPDHAYEVNAEYSFDISGRHVCDVFGKEDAGIIDENVNTPEPLECGFCHPSGRLFIRNIPGDCKMLVSGKRSDRVG